MFTLTNRDLHKLMRMNFFKVPENDMFFFGIRGCFPVDVEKGIAFRDSHQLELKTLNYKQLRCVIGQWLPKEGKFAVFPGSTVPTMKEIEAAKKNQGEGVNQLVTGLYKKYYKGLHNPAEPGKYDAFRIDVYLPVQRTEDDTDYDYFDFFDEKGRYDNIHAAYVKNPQTDVFESAGCQTIMGYPKRADKAKKDRRFEKHRGPWAVFLQNGYQQEQTFFNYALLPGYLVERISKFRVDKKMTPYLRYGSNDDTFPNASLQLVHHLQEKLNEHGANAGRVDGDFGPKTWKAVLRFQETKMGDTYKDGVVGPMTAKALGLEWIKGDFDSDRPYD